MHDSPHDSPLDPLIDPNAPPPSARMTDVDGLDLMHTRTYDVRSYRKDANTILLRGAVRDEKPAGLYIAEDTEPLEVHRMVVELDVAYPECVISRAEVVFDTHPHAPCPGIAPHYDKLVGLSISRGFTHKVRELFGGPRGCTHVTALLQAMAPVVNQSRFSMVFDGDRSTSAETDGGTPVAIRTPPTPEQRRALFASNFNTCHVWDENGERVQRLSDANAEVDPPLWILRRLAKLGLPVKSWRSSTQLQRD